MNHPFGSTESKIQSAIKVAADDISKLRRPDVFRVLSEAKAMDILDPMVQYLTIQRVDLVPEMSECLTDLN
jgi:hypothetical protein